LRADPCAHSSQSLPLFLSATELLIMAVSSSPKLLKLGMALLLLASSADSKTLRGTNDKKGGFTTDVFTDVATDGSVDFSADASTDTSTDSFTNTSTNLTTDSLSDASTDSFTDSISDVATDSFTDSSSDASTDVATDASTDESANAFSNSSTDSATDVEADAFTDAAVDHSSDALTDVSTDAATDISTDTSADMATDESIEASVVSVTDSITDALDATDFSSDFGVDFSTNGSSDVELAGTTEFPTTQCMERRTLYIGISSAPTEKSAEKRALVRNTWMQYPYFQQSDCIAAKFFIGTEGLDADATQKLEQEAEVNQDMVFMPLEESYENLANKTVTLLKWFAANTDARMVMKLDEDTFPHMRSIISFLQHQPANQKYVYMGSFMWQHPVLHDGKWAEREDYTSAFYPPFADGPGYLLSSELVKKMAEEGFYEAPKLLNNEDAHVGEMLSQIPQASLVRRVDIKATQWGCKEGDLVSMQLGESQFKCMWELQEAGYSDDELCCGDYTTQEEEEQDPSV